MCSLNKGKYTFRFVSVANIFELYEITLTVKYYMYT